MQTETEYKWEDLSLEDVVYLLKILPQLQHPRSSEIEKLISALKNHPTIVDNQYRQLSTSSNLVSNRSKGKQTRKSSRGDKISSTARGTQKKASFSQRERDEEARKIKESEERRKKEGKMTDARWTIGNSNTPVLTNNVRDLIMELVSISSSSKDSDLDAFVQNLIKPDKSDLLPDGNSFEEIFCVCEKYDNKTAVDDFYHMVSLIQIAIHVERVKPHLPVEAIADRYGIDCEKLRERLQYGTRLILLVASSSFYILMIIATLHMKTKFVYRKGNATTTIISLANVLRNPGMYNSAISDIIEEQLIPTIRKLYIHDQLSKKLTFASILSLENSEKFTLNFHDLSAIETYLNEYQTNTFRLPDRSPIWRKIKDFGYPNWSIPAEAIQRQPTIRSTLPQPHYNVEDVYYIRTSFTLPDKPTKPKDIQSIESKSLSKTERRRQLEEAWRKWTDKERKATDKAIEPVDLQDFESKLDELYKDGKRVKGKYVKLPAHIINGKTIRIDDEIKNFGALVISDPSGWLKDQLGRVHNILKLIRPHTMVPKEMGTNVGAFESIHLDMWNRFVEKGNGAPENVHPDLIRKMDKKKVNHDQRIPYLSKAVRNDPETTTALDNVLADICHHVHDLVKTYLPEEYKTVKAFVDVLPLNHSPTSYPFSSLVVNIQVATNGHADEGDETICVVLPLGEWEDGSLVLYELGIVVELSVGDMTIFSSRKILHFNRDFEGIRCSIVLFGDRHGKDWTRYRNGWDQHIVIKEYLYGKTDSQVELNSCTGDAMLVDVD